MDLVPRERKKKEKFSSFVDLQGLRDVGRSEKGRGFDDAIGG